MSSGISSEKQCQCAIAGHIAGCCKSIMECKNSEHQGNSGITEFQDSGKGSKGCHYSSPGKSGGTHGTGGKQDAEDHHVTGSGNRTIKNPGDHHGKKNFRKYRTTVVNLRKNRNGFFAQTLNETGAAFLE